MNAEQFLIEAAKISNDPKSRLSENTKKIIEQNNFMFDAHCHIFDAYCINVGYFVLRVVAEHADKFIAKILRKIILGEKIDTQDLLDKNESDYTVEDFYSEIEKFSSGETDTVLKRTEKELKKTNQLLLLNKANILFATEKFDKIKKIIDIIQILRTNEMEQVYKLFRKKYSLDNVYEKKKELITIVLGMDLEEGWGVDIKKKNFKQIEELNALATKKPVLPFVPLDPRREFDEDPNNLYRTFLKAFQEGSNYYGVKIYPALGYLPSDKRLSPIFKICAEKQIPVITHCGGEVVSSYLKKISVNDGEKTYDVPGDTREDRARYLNEPEHWIKVLEKYPTLRLNLGHWGSEKAWADTSDVRHKRIETITGMMKKYDYVYADFSFNLINDAANKNFMNAMTGDPILAKRTLFGTDFWVVLPKGDLVNGQRKFITQSGTKAYDFTKKNVLDFLNLK